MITYGAILDYGCASEMTVYSFELTWAGGVIEKKN
jgi:hypothetical protein